MKLQNIASTKLEKPEKSSGKFKPLEHNISKDENTVEGVQQALEYVDRVFKAGWNADKMWQVATLACLAKHKDELNISPSVDSRKLYDNWIYPFCKENGLESPQSRRSNFIGLRLGVDTFNKDGPFTFDKNIWTLKPAFNNPVVWNAITTYWNQRVAKGFAQGSRAKRREAEAGEFLANDHAGFARDIDLRAEDAEVDGRAWYRNKWVPSQVKGFVVTEKEVQSYVFNAVLYKNGGALVADGFNPLAIDFIKSLEPKYHISLDKISMESLLTKEISTRYIFKWEPK